jgi:acyl carrier protein
MNEQLEQIVRWIQERAGITEEIPEDFDLIDGRLVNSLDFLEFLLLLESLTSCKIDLDELTVDHFRTLRAIQENFLAARVE